MNSHFDEQMRLFEAAVNNRPSPNPSFRPPAFIPHSVRMPGGPGGGGPGGGGLLGRNQGPPPPPSYPRPQYLHPTTARPGVTPLSKTVAPTMKKEYSAAPQINKNPPASQSAEDDDDIMATLMKYEKEVKSDKRKNDDPSGPDKKFLKTDAGSGPSSSSQAPPLASKSGTEVTAEEIKRKAKQMVEAVKASQVSQVKKVPMSGNSKGDKPGGKKSKKMIRMAGGQMWEDPSLLNWDSNDFRLFCGDLGNDVTDEVLNRTFSKYTSFQQAKVVRDKRTNKTKGYGFVSFKDPADFTRAIKEMDGKYVGSRPIKLRRSNWKDRNVDQVKAKTKMKNQMGYKI